MSLPLLLSFSTTSSSALRISSFKDFSAVFLDWSLEAFSARFLLFSSMVEGTSTIGMLIVSSLVTHGFLVSSFAAVVSSFFHLCVLINYYYCTNSVSLCLPMKIIIITYAMCYMLTYNFVYYYHCLLCATCINS